MSASTLITVAPRDRAYRSLKGLERTGATSRVLNLAAICARNAERGGERLAPFFDAGVLGGALIIKHRIRPGEESLFARPRYTATKVVVPFERTDLALGGRSKSAHLASEAPANPASANIGRPGGGAARAVRPCRR